MTNIIRPLGWTLVHSVWQVLAISVLLAITIIVLRKSNPSARYTASLLALFGCFIAPLITFVVMVMQDRSAAASPITITEAMVVLAKGTAAQWPSVIEPMLPQLVGIWAAGLMVMAIRFTGGLWMIERLKRAAHPLVDSALQQRVNVLAARLGIMKDVRLLITDKIDAPAVVGVLKASVLFPASALTKLTPAQIEALLAHEIAHVVRNDYIVNLLQSIVEAALFYHPAIWWISGVVRTEREHCCDDLAVEAMGDRVGYARALATLEELRGMTPRLAMNANGGSLMQRIRRIVGTPARSPRFGAAFTPYLALAAVMVPLAGFAITKKHQEDTVKDAPKANSVQKSDEMGFDRILDNPNATIYYNGKKKQVKDLTPTEREKIRAEINKSKAEMKKAKAEMSRAQVEMERARAEMSARHNKIQQSEPDFFFFDDDYDKAHTGAKKVFIKGKDGELRELKSKDLPDGMILMDDDDAPKGDHAKRDVELKVKVTDDGRSLDRVATPDIKLDGGDGVVIPDHVLDGSSMNLSFNGKRINAISQEGDGQYYVVEDGQRRKMTPEERRKLKAELEKLRVRMQELQKQLGGQFGPNSEFMKQYGPNGGMVKQFGPNSEFMKQFGKGFTYATPQNSHVWKVGPNGEKMPMMTVPPQIWKMDPKAMEQWQKAMPKVPMQFNGDPKAMELFGKQMEEWGKKMGQDRKWAGTPETKDLEEWAKKYSESANSGGMYMSPKQFEEFGKGMGEWGQSFAKKWQNYLPDAKGKAFIYNGNGAQPFIFNGSGSGMLRRSKDGKGFTLMPGSGGVFTPQLLGPKSLTPLSKIEINPGDTVTVHNLPNGYVEIRVKTKAGKIKSYRLKGTKGSAIVLPGAHGGDLYGATFVAPTAGSLVISSDSDPLPTVVSYVSASSNCAAAAEEEPTEDEIKASETPSTPQAGVTAEVQTKAGDGVKVVPIDPEPEMGLIIL